MFKKLFHAEAEPGRPKLARMPISSGTPNITNFELSFLRVACQLSERFINLIVCPSFCSPARMCILFEISSFE